MSKRKRYSIAEIEQAEKSAAHADDRLAERTDLPPSVLKELRARIASVELPRGTHHVPLRDGSSAVIKDVGDGKRKKHVVATVLASHMRRPGSDVSGAVYGKEATPYIKATSVNPREVRRKKHNVVLNRRVERQRVKDIARNRHWDDERAKGVRMRGKQLIDEYAPGVKRWRESSYVKSASKEPKKRKMSHVHPDKYNANFRLGQTIGMGAAGLSLGAATGGLAGGSNKKALVGALLGGAAGGLLGNRLYRTKSDKVVYDATKRTPRHRVRPSLLADVQDVDPSILGAGEDHFMSDEELSKTASLTSQEDIFNALKRRLPSGAHHVSGGLPDARGISDVDIYLPRKKFTGLENKFPAGTSVASQGDDYAIYSIPGFKREVNVYATSNPAKRESVDHRRTMMELAQKYPQLERKAFAIKAKGKGSEPAWAEVLGLKGDPYEVMANTDEVMRHAAQIKQASKRYRHRATLLLQDDQGRIFARKEPPERVAKGVSRVNLPGGGVHENERETRAPTKREIIRAARKEALEELGIRIRNPRLLGSKSGDLEDWWKDQQEKKRGVRFDGAAEHFVLARPSKKDMRLYNTEGDAFKGEYYDLNDLDPLVAQDAKRDSAFAQFNKKQLELMRGLQKKASRRRNRRELPYNTDNFMNKYYQAHQGDVFNSITSRYERLKDKQRKKPQVTFDSAYKAKLLEKNARAESSYRALALGRKVRLKGPKRD